MQVSYLPFVIYQPLGLVTLAASLLIAGRRLPLPFEDVRQSLRFDFHWQHASRDRALGHLVEVAFVLYVSALIASLYLSGGQGPWGAGWQWLAAKTAVVSVGVIWFRDRWLLPRWRQMDGRLWLLLLGLSVFSSALAGLMLGRS